MLTMIVLSEVSKLTCSELNVLIFLLSLYICTIPIFIQSTFSWHIYHIHTFVLLSLYPTPQLYGAATMNNTLGLGIFAALVYAQDLDWQYSAGKLLMWL